MELGEEDNRMVGGASSLSTRVIPTASQIGAFVDGIERVTRPENGENEEPGGIVAEGTGGSGNSTAPENCYGLFDRSFIEFNCAISTGTLLSSSYLVGPHSGNLHEMLETGTREQRTNRHGKLCRFSYSSGINFGDEEN
jgi:hypothetical protein